VSHTFEALRKTLQLNRLPEKVSLELGAVLEPLSVAMHGIRRASIKKGSNILVFGAGAVGLLCAAMCKASEAGNVIIADIQSERVDFALKNKFADAGIVVPMKKCNTIEEKLVFAKEVAGLVYETKSRIGSVVGEVDAVFECTGVESCLQAAIYVNSPMKPPNRLC
jgi:L-iditol 2-dehydrogenase